VAFAISAMGRLDGVRVGIATARATGGAVAELRELVEVAGRCDTVAGVNYRLRPYIAWYGDRRPEAVPAVLDPAGLDGSVAWLAPHAPAALRFTFLGRPEATAPAAPAGFRLLARTRNWSAFGRGC
jgi:hypothetical protein